MRLFEEHGTHLRGDVEEEKMVHCGEKRLHKHVETGDEGVHGQYFW